MKLLVISIIFLFFTNIISANNSIKIIPPQSKYDSSHDYFKGLLELIISETKDNYSDVELSFSNRMQQGRTFIALKNRKNLDIHWAGTSLEREKEFAAVKIPLLKGLLGYRFFIINKKKEKVFDEVENIEDLKKFKACQGTHWPDTKILQNSNLQVVKNTNYELMFLQVHTNRCDYFPRGVHEIVSEIEVRRDKYPNLMMYKKLIIYYPFPMYFFVAKENIELKKRVEEGLLKIIDNGKFDTYIKTHDVTKHLFPINSWINVKILKLENPFIHNEEKYYNKKFWVIF